MSNIVISCICQTAKGRRCSKPARPGQKMCFQHAKKCRNIIDSSKTVVLDPNELALSLNNKNIVLPLLDIVVDPIDKLFIGESKVSFMQTRLNNFKILRKLLQNLDPCLQEEEQGSTLVLKGYKDPITFTKRIGSHSSFGIVYKTYIQDGKIPIYFAAKIMADTSANRNEVSILTKLTDIGLREHHPNFPLMFKSLTCHTPCSSHTCPKLTKHNYIIVLTELAESDAKIWFQEDRTFLQYVSIISQMILTIYNFHIMGFRHNDMHLGNFLIHKIKPSGGNLEYKIGNKDIKIKHCGYLVVLWDFGLSTTILTSDEDNRQARRAAREQIKQDLDLSHLSTSKIIDTVVSWTIDYMKPLRNISLMNRAPLHATAFREWFDHVFAALHRGKILDNETETVIHMLEHATTYRKYYNNNNNNNNK